jgi:hypothetical protein
MAGSLRLLTTPPRPLQICERAIPALKTFTQIKLHNFNPGVVLPMGSGETAQG